MTPVPAQGKTEQLHFFVKPENAARYRAAFLATQTIDVEEASSFTDFLERAILRETRRLERKYNGGKQWPPVRPGVLRTGPRTSPKEDRDHQQ